MKHLVVIIATLFFNQLVFSQLQDADAFFNGSYNKDYVRTNKIKTVTVDIFIGNKLSTIYVFDFDKTGLLSKHTILDDQKNKVQEYFFKFNQYEDLIERTNKDYQLNKTYNATFANVYHESRLISQKCTELLYWKYFFYNPIGQRIKTVTFLGLDTTSASKKISYCTYDANGKLKGIKEAAIDLKGLENIAEVSTFHYDTHGNIISVTRENAPTYFIIYDANGLIKLKQLKMPGDLGGFEMKDIYSYSFWK
jgi:hypothetical protein